MDERTRLAVGLRVSAACDGAADEPRPALRYRRLAVG